MIFSQKLTLKPVLYIENKDTIFGFSILQSKFIASKLVEADYCDSISNQKSSIIFQQDSLNLFYKKQISIQKNIIANDNFIMKNYEGENSILKSDLLISEKKQKKFKNHRWYFLIIGVLSGIAIREI